MHLNSHLAPSFSFLLARTLFSLLFDCVEISENGHRFLYVSLVFLSRSTLPPSVSPSLSESFKLFQLKKKSFRFHENNF